MIFCSFKFSEWDLIGEIECWTWSILPIVDSDWDNTFLGWKWRPAWWICYRNALFQNCNLQRSEWQNVSLWDIIVRLTGRMGCRIPVGFPLCRDSDFLELCIRFSRSITTSGIIINLLPSFLRPWVLGIRIEELDWIDGNNIIGPWFSSHEKHRRLAPLLRKESKWSMSSARVGQGNQWIIQGQQANLQGDLLIWLIDEAKREDARLDTIAIVDQFRDCA